MGLWSQQFQLSHGHRLAQARPREFDLCQFEESLLTEIGNHVLTGARAGARPTCA